MLCDREIITECLQIWFGSVTDFEVTGPASKGVQGQLLPICLGFRFEFPEFSSGDPIVHSSRNGLCCIVGADLLSGDRSGKGRSDLQGEIPQAAPAIPLGGRSHHPNLLAKHLQHCAVPLPLPVTFLAP